MMVTIKIIVVISIITNVFSYVGEGHLKPLGFQRKSEGHIEVTTEIPDVKTFFEKYITGSKPIVFKGAAKNMPAYSKWTDEFLKERFGDLPVDVEEGKKENRSLGVWKWSFKEFLQTYQKKDIYMVYTLGKEMLKDLLLFPSLSCGGYLKVLQELIMWLSSGGTKSVLHNDGVDNINCLFSGTKKLYMVDRKHREFIDIDAPEGAFSKVNVDAVDLDRYPGLSKAPWWEANMEAGDCLFIPFKWYHQVSSFADGNRNMAVNLWFYHMKKINLSDCDDSIHANTFISFDNAEFGNKNIEAVRYVLLLELENQTEISRKKMVKAIASHSMQGEISKNDWRDILRILDKDRNKKVSVEEIIGLTHEELKILSVAFPGLYKEDGDGESDEYDDDEISGEEIGKNPDTDISDGDPDKINKFIKEKEEL